MDNQYKGRSLFKDIEDTELRTDNQAKVLCNIICENAADKVTLRSGLKLYQGYFSMIKPDDRAAVMVKASGFIAQRINEGTVTMEVEDERY